MTALQSAGTQKGSKRKASKEKENGNQAESRAAILKVDDEGEEEGAADEDCAECRLPLARSSHLINIVDHPGRWHAECFRCALCRAPMDKRQSCHVYRNQVICRDDYLRLKRDHAVHCARCRWPIAASDWVRKAASHVYHIACFNCDICLRQLNTGEQFIISGQQRAQSAIQPASQAAPQPALTTDEPSVAGDKVRLLCRLHFNVDAGASSAADFSSNTARATGELATAIDCGNSESPNGNEKLHAKNFSSVSQFSEQHQQQQKFSQLLAPRNTSARSSPALRLDQSAAHSSDCQETAVSMVRQQLASSSNDFSAKLGGDANQRPACTSSTTTTTTTTTALAIAATNLSSSSSSSAASTSSLHTNYLSPMTPTNSSQTSSGLPCKSKRVRTTFTEDQLSILQTHFHIDSNPDGQDLERIATITGLSKRVTQVWFQNSRARQKKYMIKRKPLSGAATLALAASFSMATGGLGGGGGGGGGSGSPPGGQQAANNFRLAPFASPDDAVFGADHEANRRDHLAGARLDLAASNWRESQADLKRQPQQQQQPRLEDVEEQSLNGNLYQGNPSSASTSDESDRCSMIMDEDSRQSDTTD